MQEPCDQDYDGFTEDVDCDDLNPEVLGPMTWWQDADADGFVNPDSEILSCTPPDFGVIVNFGFDCDDNSAEAFPDNPEVLDGLDNDCNGLIDDGLDTTPPVITLIGADTITLEVGIDTYTEQGATVTDNDPAYSESVSISGMADTNTVGTYMVYYIAPPGAAGIDPLTVTRTVNVQDTTPPVITTEGNITTEATGPNGATVNYVVTAEDDTDGMVQVTCDPLSGTVFLIKTTTVTCTATDSFGNESTEMFDVTVEDTTAPSITLTGEPVIELLLGETYADVGATASDIVDDDAVLTNLIATLNPVDVLTAGEYTVSYNVSDNAGNPATEVTRTVKVFSQILTTNQSGNVNAGPGDIVIISGSSTVSGNIENNGGTIILQDGSSIDGNVSLANGGTINLSSSTISGNVNGNDGTISITAGSTVEGNVISDGSTSVTITDSTVDGNIEVNNAQSVSITGNAVNGNLEINNTSGECSDTGNAVNGNFDGCQ